MMKKQLCIFIIVSFLVLLTACQEQNDPAEKAPLENLFAQSELSYGEYLVIFKDVVSRVDAMNIQDPELKRWVIRAIGDEKLTNKRDLSEAEAMEKAQENYQQNKAWMTVAEKKYGITISDEELDIWLEEGPDQADIPLQKAYADALGLTIKELNRNFDRELYEPTLLWEKLIPVLEEEHGTTEREKLLEAFEKEVDKTL
ncbi:hypothetical protein [Sutcliffiella halmapala]|uniref:hypothetical protein n=1 Tax=Sutcliffiella halmapala TaxID=79882 RepID=UPI001B8099EE|nr:hypothetical protein [Sutcliffiella halmapala]